MRESCGKTGVHYGRRWAELQGVMVKVVCWIVGDVLMRVWKWGASMVENVIESGCCR